MQDRTDQLAARLSERFPDLLLSAYPGLDMPVLEVRAYRIVEACTHLRDAEGFDMLSDLSGVDRHPDEPRFEVNYHLLAMQRVERVRVKVRVPTEAPRLPSVVPVWPAADWQEREVYDFFGVEFEGHPALARLFMPDEWVGHPLRKDYPVGGVPVEYRIEPSYVGEGHVITDLGRPSAGGPPPRLIRDRGRRTLWTWTGPPASGVRQRSGRRPPEGRADE